jgi:hypothetical protein
MTQQIAPTDAQQALKDKKRQTALNNLKKARAAKAASTCTLIKSASMIPSESSLELSSESTSREQVESTCKDIMYHVGVHVQNMVKSTSKSSSELLLKNAYGFKSMADTYLNYAKQVYPLGLQDDKGSHLNHLLGSIMGPLHKMLMVNVQVNMGQNATPQPIDITPEPLPSSTDA